MQRSMDSNKGLLRDLEGIVRIVDFAMGDPVGALLISLDKYTEAIVLSSERTRDELGIVNLSSQARPRCHSRFS
jgi:hypothetical protein